MQRSMTKPASCQSAFRRLPIAGRRPRPKPPFSTSHIVSDGRLWRVAWFTQIIDWLKRAERNCQMNAYWWLVERWWYGGIRTIDVERCSYARRVDIDCGWRWWQILQDSLLFDGLIAARRGVAPKGRNIVDKYDWLIYQIIDWLKGQCNWWTLFSETVVRSHVEANCSTFPPT